MLNHVIFFFIIYANMIFIFIFKRLGHIHIDKNLFFFVIFQNKDFLFVFVFLMKFEEKQVFYSISL